MTTLLERQKEIEYVKLLETQQKKIRSLEKHIKILESTKIKEVEWIKGFQTAITKNYFNDEYFAPFEKEDLIDFAENIKKEGAKLAKEEILNEIEKMIRKRSIENYAFVLPEATNFINELKERLKSLGEKE